MGGTLTLSGTNTYTGGTTLTNGTLSVGTSANLGAAASNLSFNGGTLQVTGTALTNFSGIGHTVVLNAGTTVGLDINNAANIFTVDQVLSQGSGGFTKLGAGTAILNQVNTYTGTTTVSAGTLTLSGSGTLGATSAPLAMGGGTLDLGTTSQTVGAVTLTAGNTIQNGTLTGTSYVAGNGSGNAIVTAILAGAGAVSETGAGTLTLSGPNTYSGGTTLTAGTVSVGAASNLGTGGILTFNGGTLQVTGTSLTSLSGTGHTAAFTAAKTVSLDINNAANTFTVDSVLNQTTGGFTKLGAGTAILNQANTYTGVNTLTAGTLSVGATANLGAAGAGLTFNGGTLQITGTGLTNFTGIGHTVTFTNNTSVGLDINNAANTFTVDKVLALGTGGFTKLGAGTATLSLANTYTGTTKVSAGTLSISGPGTLGVAAPLTLAGGTLDLGGTSQTVAAVNITAAAASGNTIQNGSLTGLVNTTYTASNASGNAIVAANLLVSGTAGVTQSGAGTLTLSGNNTYTGATTLTNGTVSAGVTANLGAAAAGLTFNGGNLQITGTTLTNFTGIGHAVTFTAAKTVGLDINNAANTFTVDQVLNQTTGGFTKLGAGTAVLNQANTYTGTTTVSAGTLTLSGVGTLGTGALVMGGGTLDLGTGSKTTGAVTIATAAASGNTIQNGSLTGSSYTASNASGNAIVTASLLGGGTLTKSGAGTLTLTGANTYTGTTTVNAGTLDLGGSTATGSLASTITLGLGGGTLNYTRTGGTTQTFAGTTINAGSSAVNTVASDTIALTALTRNVGGTVDFGIAGTITTTTPNSSGIIGGYATVAGTDWATSGASGTNPITALTSASYTSDTWGTGFNTTVTTASNTIADGTNTNSLRFNGTAQDTVTLAGTSIINSGGILVTSNVGAFTSQITGGTLEGANGKDLVVIQNNTLGALQIDSVIANNGTTPGLTKSGCAKQARGRRMRCELTQS